MVLKPIYRETYPRKGGGEIAGATSQEGTVSAARGRRATGGRTGGWASDLVPAAAAGEPNPEKDGASERAKVETTNGGTNR